MDESPLDSDAALVRPPPLAERRQSGRAAVFRSSRAPRAARARRSLERDLPSARLTMAALAGADLAALALAGAGGGAAVLAAGQPLGGAAVAALIALAALVHLTYGLIDLYPAVGLDRVEELRRMATVAIGAGAALTAIVLVGSTSVRFVGALVPAAIAAWLLVLLAPTSRAMLRHVAAPRPWWGVPAVVLGDASATERFVTKLRRSPDAGLRPIACFSEEPSDVGQEVAGVPIVGRYADAVHYRSIGVRHALVVDAGIGAPGLGAATAFGRAFPSVMVVPRIDGLGTGGLAAAPHDDPVALGLASRRRSRRHDVAKRALDLLLIVPASLVAAPLVAICAAAVAIASPGNPFYYQAREGRGGRTIKVWKLRTMHRDAEALLERYLNENPTARTEWERRFKLAVDPRILPGIGTLLRRTSLDELPQLWCILRGDMSFVGPRPFPSYHLAAFGEPFRELRRSVPPGLTGLWQVSGRAEGDVGVQEELDTHYIRHWTIWMDVYVLARTPVAVLLGKGAT